MGSIGWNTGLTVMLIGVASISYAQEGVVPKATTSQNAAMSDEVAEKRGDPFGLDGIAKKAPQIKTAPPGFRPAEILPARLPQMTLRGIGRMDGRDQPTALLEIGQFGLFVVTENDTISLQGMAGDNVMRIVEINDISVTVEAGSFGELIVVR